MKKDRKTFWVTNISSRNVTLSDLNISIKAMSSVDLLSNNHHLSEETLEKSLNSGSLFIKKDKIIKRLVPPADVKSNNLNINSNAVIPSRQRSVLEIKIEEYEELKLSNDKEESLKQEFEAIAETADTVEYDRQPLLPKK